MFDSAVDKLSKDGVKVIVDVPNPVYIKLAACIVVAVIIGTLGSVLVKSIFTSK